MLHLSAILAGKKILYIPISLYIHIPWCIRKCPYCDFNSHEAKGSLPQELYVNALMAQLDNHLPFVQDRPLVSIFFGGGTPSLFSADMIARILEGVSNRITLSAHTEITLEANPGTIDQERFQAFRQAGINRLSMGIQSLQDDKLKILGRIHDSNNALRAIQLAKEAGFGNFNIDLMYGLPHQSIDDALHDLQLALDEAPTHLSWYQLTIEPNTVFYKRTPPLPPDELIWDMQLAGQALLQQAGMQQYEVSAYSLPNKRCLHNLNYWEFGDYLGLGAGAHSKITDTKGNVQRAAQVRQPTDYLDPTKRAQAVFKPIAQQDLIFEFMLNALRLTEGFPIALFSERTGMSLECIQPILKQAVQRGLLMEEATQIRPSALGAKFLNDLMMMFLYE